MTAFKQDNDYNYKLVMGPTCICLLSMSEEKM